MAERGGGALDRKLSARAVGSHYCGKRTPFEETSVRLCSLSPRGPHASRTREGNSGGRVISHDRLGGLHRNKFTRRGVATTCVRRGRPHMEYLEYRWRPWSTDYCQRLSS